MPPVLTYLKYKILLKGSILIRPTNPLKMKNSKPLWKKIREAAKKYQEKQEQEKKNLLEKLIQN